LAGTVEWVDKLKFEGAEDWKLTNRKPIVVNDVVEGYYKKLGNLGMYWVDRAGHMVLYFQKRFHEIMSYFLGPTRQSSCYGIYYRRCGQWTVE
jgi:hypothetical protein